MVFRSRTLLVLALLIVATLAAMPAAIATADDQPDTLVMGTIRPVVAGQFVGVTVAGVACAGVQTFAPNGVTDANGNYQLVVHNCPAGIATLTVNGVPTATQFNLVPGNVYTEGVPASWIVIASLARD